MSDQGGALREAMPSRRHNGYVPLDASLPVQLRSALFDIGEGVRAWRTWTYLAMQTIKSQYRRTVLGPWWLTLQTSAYVVGLGLIFSRILHTGLKSFLPYVAIGFIGFTLILGLIRAASTTFTGAAAAIQSARQPLTTFVFRDMTVQLVQLSHNLVIYLVFLAMGVVPVTPKSLIALPVLALIMINGCLFALWLGPTVARFRDVDPFVAAVMQMLVFFTPVFYRPSDLGGQRGLIRWNPLTYILDSFRDPLINAPLHLRTYVIFGAIMLFNLVFGLLVFSRSRSRIAYWIA
jgi:ABC-2 type transport system permease protein/lipopolysaccharide transport system permease protein